MRDVGHFWPNIDSLKNQVNNQKFKKSLKTLFPHDLVYVFYKVGFVEEG